METISYNEFLTMFSEKAYERDVPVSGTFELTPLCNLDCKMCYVHLQDPSVRYKVLTGAQWISIMKEAIDNGMLHALLTGGELLTHPDFWEIYMFLFNNGVIPRIKTNGVLLDEKAVEIFRKYPPYMIDISLYGCSSESYVAVTGADVYETVVRNIKNVISADLPLRITITPSAYMMPWFDEIMELAESFGVKIMLSSMLYEPYGNTGRIRRDFELSEGEIKRIDRKVLELYSGNRILLKKNENELEESSSGKPDVSEKGLYCNAGRTGFTINWDGTMSPCIGYPRFLVCAEPFETGFASAWEKINVSVKNYAVPEKCHVCEYNTKCHYCPVEHLRFSEKNQCDSDVCNYWMNFYDNELQADDE